MTEILDIENSRDLASYLESRHGISQNLLVRIIVLNGGVSNKTVQVDMADGRSWVLKQSLEKLRVKGNWHSNPERIFREAEGIRWLSSFLPSKTIPAYIFEDKSQYLLAMETVARPFENFKEQLMTGIISQKIASEAGNLLGLLHQQGTNKNNKIPSVFCNRDFFQALRIEPYYVQTAKKEPRSAKFLDQLISKCHQSNYTIVHGDFSPKNLLVKDDHLVLIDHEVIHFGDGTFDIGFFLCHLLSKANHMITHRAELIEMAHAFIQAYAKAYVKLEPEQERRAIGHTLGCLIARVHGLSPLEYLTKKDQRIQSQIVLDLICKQPESLIDMIVHFQSKLNHANY